jgi:hypothetical protein
MLLFRDEEHVDRWRRMRDLPVGGLLTPDQTERLARGWYGGKLARDWRRHTLEETEALLAEVGLTGPFWDLRKE